jgi:hypothetical protein
VAFLRQQQLKGPRSGIVPNSLWARFLGSLVTDKNCTDYLAKLGNLIAKKNSSLLSDGGKQKLNNKKLYLFDHS